MASTVEAGPFVSGTFGTVFSWGHASGGHVRDAPSLQAVRLGGLFAGGDKVAAVRMDGRVTMLVQDDEEVRTSGSHARPGAGAVGVPGAAG